LSNIYINPYFTTSYLRRNTIIISVIVLLFSINIFGQENKIDFGVKAGVNYSTLFFGNDVPSEFPASFNGKIGFHIGGFMRYKFSEKLMLKPELLFSTQGAEYLLDTSEIIIDPNNPTFNNNYKADINEYMLLLPILLDYYFNPKFDVEFGPQFAYVVSNEITDNNDNIELSLGNYDKFEVDLCLGIGYNFSEKYRVGLRYNFGITERNNRKSSVFQLGLQFRI